MKILEFMKKNKSAFYFLIEFFVAVVLLKVFSMRIGEDLELTVLLLLSVISAFIVHFLSSIFILSIKQENAMKKRIEVDSKLAEK